MVTVERNRRIVHDIDDKSKHGDLGAQRAQGGVREKRGAKLAPLKRLVDFDWRARSARPHPKGRLADEVFAQACVVLNQIVALGP